MDLNQTEEPRFTDEEMAEVDILQSDPTSEYYYNDPDESYISKLKRKLEPYSEDFKGFIEYLFTPSRHFGTGQYSEGGLEAQTDNAFSKAISKRPGFRSFSDAKGQVSKEELKEGIDNAATYLVPFYDSGVNMSNVIEEYMKPESERDYDYIKQQFTDAGQSAAIEAGMILLGGVVFKYGGQGIKALYNKAKQYEVDPNAVSALGAGAIRKKPDLKSDERIPIRPINQSRLEASGLPYKAGGEFTDARTKEILTNKNASSVNIKVKTNEPPKGGMPQASMDAAGLDAEEVGSSGPKIYTNLVKPTSKGNKAGWKWLSRKDENLDTNTLVSVVQRNKHYFTLEADFSKGAKLQTYPNNLSEPRLRPTANGKLEFGEEIGTISLSGKKHPVYNKITAFNEGGVAMNEQMEMAFMKQGGIQDDGMNKDPVSGNPIPPGSMASEVRDDIPAMLSEGEYVVPADVLRYYGVNFFEDLRNKAKTGLQTMEADGRIGGQPLSPDQVQRNMQSPPQVNQPTPAPVRASAGMLMNLGTASGQQNFGLSGDTSLNDIPQFNPQDYTVVGGTAYNPPPSTTPTPQNVLSTKTFVNANNPSDVRVIEYINGQIKDPKMTKYTQPPYYLQGSQALADAMKSNDNDDPDPPETTPKPKFGEGVDWTDPMAYAKELVEGPDGLPKIIEGLSVFAGPFGMAAAGTASTAISLQKIADLRATAIIADAQGDQATVDYINAELNKITGKNSSSYLVQALEKSVAPGTAKAIEVLDRLGMKYKEKDGKFTFTDKDRKYNNLKDRESAIDKQLDDNKDAAETALENIQSGGGDNDSGTTIQDIIDASDDPEDTQENLDDVIAGLETGAQTGTIQLNKGGLMTKAKKKK